MVNGYARQVIILRAISVLMLCIQGGEGGGGHGGRGSDEQITHTR